MSELTIKGKITVINDIQKGTSKAGKEWKKLTFVVSNNEGYEGREQVFAFEIFGDEKVGNFVKYNKLGQDVEVSYNIKCNAWTKDGKTSYFTSLDAWKVFGGVTEKSVETESAKQDDDLPF